MKKKKRKNKYKCSYLPLYAVIKYKRWDGEVLTGQIRGKPDSLARNIPITNYPPDGWNGEVSAYDIIEVNGEEYSIFNDPDRSEYEDIPKRESKNQTHT